MESSIKDIERISRIIHEDYSTWNAPIKNLLLQRQGCYEKLYETRVYSQEETKVYEEAIEYLEDKLRDYLGL
jgi:xylose isomerase